MARAGGLPLPTFEVIDHKRRRLVEDFRYGDVIVPKWHVWDGASTLGLILRRWNSQYVVPTLIHDYLYEHLNHGNPDPKTYAWRRKNADRIFRECLRDYGVNISVRIIMWTAVRAWGANPWLKMLVVK